MGSGVAGGHAAPLPGFEGRTLLVRAADPDTAWLWLAPAGDAAAGAPSAASCSGWGAGGGRGAGSKQQQLAFRCLEEAIEAAADGDTLLLLPGTHNVRALGGLEISKRLRICGADAAAAPPAAAAGQASGSGSSDAAGAAAGQAAVIDFRGNSPLFRITRCAAGWRCCPWVVAVCTLAVCA